MYESHRYVEISDEATKHYNFILDELQLLADLSHMDWKLMTYEAYARNHNISFREGTIVGLAIGGIVYIGNKIYTKHKSTQKESEES